MSTQRRNERRQEVAVIRNDAAMAARNGQSISHMPREHRGTMNEIQWKEAYRRELERLEQTAEQEAQSEHEAEIDAVRTAIETLKSIEDLKECLRLILVLIEDQS